MWPLRASYKMSTAHQEIRASFLPKANSLYEEQYRHVGEFLTELSIPRLDFMRIYTECIELWVMWGSCFTVRMFRVSETPKWISMKFRT